MAYSPWADAAERHPGIHIERCDIAPSKGAWVPSERVILLDVALDQDERRSVLAHEVAHVDLEHEPAGGWFGRRMEREADILAARRLLGDIEEIADAICEHPLQPGLVAERLCVPLRVLRRRLEALSDQERAIIQAHLHRREHAC